MRTSRFGTLLLAIGGAVGVAAVIGLVVGFEPASLPRSLINIAVYKLTFVAAAGLLAAGAVLHRYARRGESKPGPEGGDAVVSGGRRSALGEGSPGLGRVGRDEANAPARLDTPR
ncbi:MAG TPA: hypothetical protein VFZ21_03545 [Gemmatimonadaceae bacterium]|jgi:hypothetical protein|nr:hypothetical protein [Gemmatimonadaceae bacterium]